MVESCSLSQVHKPPMCTIGWLQYSYTEKWMDFVQLVSETEQMGLRVSEPR